MEPGQAQGGRRKFVVPTPAQEPEAPLVRPFFKSFAAAPSPTEPGPPSLPRPSSYADYVVKQAATALVPRAAPASALASKQGAAPEPPPPGKEAKAPSPTATHSTEGSEGGPGPGDAALSPTFKPGVRSNSIIVRPCQRGNPVLKFVRNVPWEFGDVVPDYVLGPSTCALFLSLRYHNLKPDYIHERLRRLGRTFALQILLLQVDVKDPHKALKELAKICILADCTLVLAWSPEEAGRYLETYKAYEQKPPDLLMEKIDQDFLSQMTNCLTSVKSVNKTNTLSLLSAFGSLASITQASREDLSLCPGVGPQKAKRLFDALHEPFLKVPRQAEPSLPRGVDKE